MSRFAFQSSQAMLARLRAVDALASARPGMFFTGYERIGGYPVFATRGRGPYVWDVDGNRYIDYLLGYGSVVLGHADEAVTAAVAHALRAGANRTLLCVEQLELAEKIVNICPGAELVTFLKTGSDAVSAAVRLARAVTGRSHVLHWGLHGWHDWCAVGSSGVLGDTKSRIHRFEFNDLASTEALLKRWSGHVAAIVMMPYELEHPAPGYLESVRRLAHDHGALFILDEIRSGFRLALGGAQEYFGVRADLTTFSKAIANGHAISALVGRQQYMQRILDVQLTVTYYRSADAMAAALATIEQLEAQDGPAQLETLGRRLMAGLDAEAARAGVPVRSVGLPATPFVTFALDSRASRERAMRRFCNGMLARGVLLTPAHHWFVCVSMTKEDIDYTVHAAGDVFREVALSL